MLIGFLSGYHIFLPSGPREGLPPGHSGIPPGQAKKMGPPSVRVVGTPGFIWIPGTNVRLMVDIEADIFSLIGSYHYFHGGSWYVGRHYKVPWRAVSSRSLPPGLKGKSPRELKAKVRPRVGKNDRIVIKGTAPRRNSWLDRRGILFGEFP